MGVLARCDARGQPLSRGSGLLVGPRQVLTAAHNIYDSDGNRPDSLHVVPARNVNEQPFGRFEAVAFTTSSRYITRPAARQPLRHRPRDAGRRRVGRHVEGHRRRRARPLGQPAHGAGDEPAPS